MFDHFEGTIGRSKIRRKEGRGIGVDMRLTLRAATSLRST
jgi:hypothetical protein